MPNYADSEFEDLEDFFDNTLEYKQYYFKDSLVYKVEGLISKDDSDNFDVTPISDGKYTFNLCYYNGGCSFDEALDYGFEKL